MINLNRRSLITGLISLVAAPAIIRAGSLMPVKLMTPTPVIGTLDFPIGINLLVDTTINGQRLYRPDGSPLLGGDLVAGEVVHIGFDGKRWIALG